MDLSKFTTDDLKALRAGDLAKVSTGGLRLLQQMQRQPKQVETPQWEKDAQATLNTTPAELIAGSAPVRFAMGAAAPILGVAQMTANALPGRGGQAVNEYLTNLEGMKRRGMAQQPNAVVDAVLPDFAQNMDVAGAVGEMVNPIGLQSAKLLGPAASLGGRVAQGFAMGASQAALNPITGDRAENFWTEKAGDTALGGVVGGAIPLAVSAVESLVTPAAKAAYHVVEPHLPGGRERVMARTLNTAAGTRRTEVLNELQNPRQFVPGSQPIAGEAAAPAGSAEFSALQKIVSDLDPSEYAAREASNEAARQGAVRTVSGGPGARDAAVAARSSTTGPMYDLAYTLGIDPAGLGVNPGVQRELNQLLKTPALKQALIDARELAANERVNLRDPAAQVKGLDYVKRALDDQIQASSGNEQRILQSLKEQFVNVVDTLSPEYGAARSTFSAMSRPINQMDIGQYLEDKLVKPLAGTGERPAVYAQALRDAPGTIKRATGQPRFDSLDQVLDPNQMQAVTGVADDLARQGQYEQLARAGMSEAAKLTQGMSKEIRFPNMLERSTMLANAILARLQGKASEEILRQLSVEMRDPQRVAQIMNSAPPAVRRIISEEAAAMARNMASGVAGQAVAQ